MPDPDIMYEGEGVQVMDSCYEGLVYYKSGTSGDHPRPGQVVDVSEDQLTYTFKLQPGVKFHDGTPADAAAWIKSFERRADVNQGPAYMVTGIAKSEAPDPTTFVVTLKEPNNAFLHYAACPWQMFAVSPTAVKTNAVGDDLAQEWLKTHDAGTGPYVMKEFVPGSHYTLEAFPGYWGEQALLHDGSHRDHARDLPPRSCSSTRARSTWWPRASRSRTCSPTSRTRSSRSSPASVPPMLVLFMNFSAGVFKRQGPAPGHADRPGPHVDRRHRLQWADRRCRRTSGRRTCSRPDWPRSPTEFDLAPLEGAGRSRCRRRSSTWPG